MSLLEKINSPEDLNYLDIKGLELLGEEIRELIIDVVSKTGGHLGSNLGAVELTLALHSEFNFLKDRLILDVGHQCYTHKILTGRKKGFSSLRKYGGISGFPKRSESPYDAFGVGHSSTSISAVTGFALARQQLKEKYHIVGVIGDGALTAGTALEGLNHLGSLKMPAIIILNDNEMSISENVGGMSNYLNRIRTDPGYYRLKKDIKLILKSLPMLGSKVTNIIDKIKQTFKYLMVPGLLFEELGFTYIGPINGHDIKSLKENLKAAKKSKTPVLMHVYTKKGKGYEPAESHPLKYHSAPCFNKADGEKITSPSKKSFTQVFGSTLVELAKKDRRIVGITAAMCDGTGLSEFSKKFPDRFFDVGICEPHAVTMAAAMACKGLKPVVAIYSTFLQRAYDQIIHDVALQKLNVIFMLDRAGLVGSDGPTHHGSFDLAYLRTIPEITIMAPRNGRELQRMMFLATELNGPVAIRYPKAEIEEESIDNVIQELDYLEHEVLKPGKDLVIAGVGPIILEAVEIANELEKENISIEIIDAKFIKPLSNNLITHLKTFNKPVITLEESTITGGFGSAVSEKLAKTNNHTPVLVRGIPDSFITHGSNAKLFEKAGLSKDELKNTIRNYLRSDKNEEKSKKTKLKKA